MILDFRFSIFQTLELVLRWSEIPFVGASLLAIQDVRYREQARSYISQAEIQNQKSKTENLKSQTENLKSEISNQKSQIS